MKLLKIGLESPQELYAGMALSLGFGALIWLERRD